MAGGLALRGHAAGRPFVRLLPLRAAQRADLQPTHRGHEDRLRRLAGRPPAGRARATRTSPSATSRRSPSVHDLLVVEPTHPDEVAPILDLLLDEHTGSGYVRLTSPPVELGFPWPGDGAADRGRVGAAPGYRRHPGRSRPDRPARAVGGRDRAGARGISAGVVAMPWANRVDASWWRVSSTRRRTWWSSTTTSPAGGLGCTCSPRPRSPAGAAAAPTWRSARCRSRGSNDEVLRQHGLDAASLVAAVQQALEAR